MQIVSIATIVKVATIATIVLLAQIVSIVIFAKIAIHVPPVKIILCREIKITEKILKLDKSHLELSSSIYLNLMYTLYCDLAVLPDSIMDLFNLDFNYYKAIFEVYFNAGFKGLGPTDEFIEIYCMGNEL